MNRRHFMKSAALFSAAGAMLGTGLPLAGAAQGSGKSQPKASPRMNTETIRGYNPDMQYRPHGNTGVHVSALGFGMLRLPMLEDRKTVDQPQTIEMLRYAIDQGINYVDTAYRYLGGQSEETVGKALLNGYRDKVYLASKSPTSFIQKESDFDRLFDESRKRLQADTLDFYLLHFLNDKAWNDQVLPFKLIEKMERYKQDGKIRFSGFSFHDSVIMFKKIVDANQDWNFCQIIMNYLDTEFEAGMLGLKYASNRGLGVNCMQPLKNALLVKPPKPAQDVFDAAAVQRTPVEWALDYLWNMPEVGLALSGMGNMKQVQENLEYTRRSSVGMLGLQDSMVLSQAVKRYREMEGVIPCTGCYYCLPCPKEVAIGYLLGNIHFEYKAVGNERRARNGYNNLPATRGVNASACDGCGQCIPKCPQGINIPSVLREMHDEFKA